MSGADEVDILRLGHLEHRVTDLARARAFYADGRTAGAPGRGDRPSFVT